MRIVYQYVPKGAKTENRLEYSAQEMEAEKIVDITTEDHTRRCESFPLIF
jgi:hypothetical protein